MPTFGNNRGGYFLFCSLLVSLPPLPLLSLPPLSPSPFFPFPIPFSLPLLLKSSWSMWSPAAKHFWCFFHTEISAPFVTCIKTHWYFLLHILAVYRYTDSHLHNKIYVGASALGASPPQLVGHGGHRPHGVGTYG